jgi:SAM-dependent methyltransferase
MTLTARLLTRYHGLRTEGPGRGRNAAAVGLGVFIGCIPLFGSHLWPCAGFGWLLRLNRLKMYLAANISNPLLAPFVVGTVPAALATTATWTFARSWSDPREDDLMTAAAARYLPVGIQTWEMANAKLRLDPVYREAIRILDRPVDGRVLDLGCGRGLMLALLSVARERRGGGPPLLLHGIDYRRRMVHLARRALGDHATVEQADLTTCDLPPCRVAILFDVLHCLPEPVQEALLSRLRDSVEPGGLLLLREADAGGGVRFAAVTVTNRLVALLQGRWERRFHFRTSQDWVGLLARFGFVADAVPNDEATPFANVLILARRAV